MFPSLQILQSRAPIPEKKYLANKSNIWQTKSVLINPSIVAQWDELMKDWINSLRIGDIVDARDQRDEQDRWYGDRWYEDGWYESVIRWIEVEGNRKLLYLHYIGRDKEWDEAIYADDVNRIAKRNTNTKGPHRERRCQYRYRRCRKVHPQEYRYPLSYSNNWMPK